MRTLMALLFSLTVMGCQKHQQPPLALDFAQNAEFQHVLAQKFADNQYAPIPVSEFLKEGSLMSEKLQEKIATHPRWQELEFAAPVKEQDLTAEETVWLDIPETDESRIQDLTAYDQNGHPISLDPQVAPDRPVITIGLKESLPQHSPFFNINEADLAEDIQSQKLDAVSFKDIKEPWFKGDAEVYMTVSYIDDKGKAAVTAVELLGVTKANKSYQTNKIFFLWPESKYQIIDITFFEHDAATNYKNIILTLVSAVSAIGSIEIPHYGMIIKAIAEITSEIIKALPDSLLTDDDDFIDVVNTLNKNSSFAEQKGVAQNVSVTHSTFTLKAN